MNNLMAYCTQNIVAIADPSSVQLISCLTGHQSVTTAVQWSSNSKTRGTERGNSTLLASGDEAGHIFIWDLKKAKRTCVFDEDVGHVSKRAIVSLRWLFNDDTVFLLSLSSGSVLSLWNLNNRTKVWKYEFSEPVNSISLDPFSNSCASFTSETGWIIMVNDLNTRKAPEKIEQRLKVEATKDKNGNLVSSLRDFVYSPHGRSQMYLLSRRDITMYNMDIRQPIAGKVIRGGKSDFRRLFTCEEDPNLLYSLQEDGTVAAWDYNLEKNQYEAITCDVVRGSKHGADRPGLLYGLAISPVDHKKICAVSADGKMWVWDYIQEKGVDGNKKVRWVLTGLLETTSSTISSMQVSPFNNQLAVGTSNGTLLIYDLLNGAMITKHDMFNLPVEGVRWFSETDVLCFSSKRISPKAVVNELVAVDLLTGKHRQLRTDKKNDPSCIRAIRVSYSMKFLIVLAQDRPVEIYSLKTFSLIRLLPFTAITALEWSPISSKKKSADSGVDFSQATSSEDNSGAETQKKPSKERFFFTTSDGSIHFYRMEDDKVVAESQKPNFFAYNQVSALAWRDDFLVSGDSVGSINYWDMVNKKTKTISTHRGVVRKIMFAPDSNHILVHFNEGDFAVWDLESGAKVGHSPSNVKAACADWAAGNHPIIANNAGTIMIWDMNLSSTNSSAIFNSLLEPMFSPALLPVNNAQYLRSLMENGLLTGVETCKAPPGLTVTRNAFGEYIPPDCRDKPLTEQILVHMQLIPDDLLARLKSVETNTAERCYLAAQYFGDRIGMQFWRMAKEYLTNYNGQHGENKTQQEAKNQETSIESQESNSNEETPNILSASYPNNLSPNLRKSALPTVYDLLRDNDSVRYDELSTLKMHDETVRANVPKGTASLFSRVAQEEATLNQKDQAIKLLLETPGEHKDIYMNYMHACVIAAASSAGDQLQFRQTMQFVASNLISRRNESDLDFGVELLCLIGEGFKACKLLQDFERWEKAARLAKCILPEEQSREILTRWADYLTSNNQLMKAIGIYMSLGLFKEVIDLLHKSELDDIGALFAKACLETGFDIPTLHKKTILRVTMPTDLSSPSYSSSKDHDDYETSCKKLLYFIYQQYGTFLQKIGNESLAQYYMTSLITAEECGFTKKEEEQEAPVQPTEQLDEEIGYSTGVEATNQEETEDFVYVQTANNNDLLNFSDVTNKQDLLDLE